MDILENALSASDTPSVSKGEKTFMNHVLRFDESTKNELMDVFQYAVTAVVPILLLNNLISNLFPEPDPNKAILEIVFEVGSELFMLIFGIYMIHRFVTYFPLFSGNAYKQMNIINIVLVLLIIILSFQTQLGEKATILLDHLKSFIFYNTDGSSAGQEQPQRPSREGFKEGATPSGRIPEHAIDNPINLRDIINSKDDDTSQRVTLKLPDGIGNVDQNHQESFVPEPFVGGGFGSTF